MGVAQTSYVEVAYCFDVVDIIHECYAAYNVVPGIISFSVPSWKQPAAIQLKQIIVAVVLTKSLQYRRNKSPICQSSEGGSSPGVENSKRSQFQNTGDVHTMGSVLNLLTILNGIFEICSTCLKHSRKNTQPVYLN